MNSIALAVNSKVTDIHTDMRTRYLIALLALPIATSCTSTAPPPIDPDPVAPQEQTEVQPEDAIEQPPVEEYPVEPQQPIEEVPVEEVPIEEPQVYDPEVEQEPEVVWEGDPTAPKPEDDLIIWESDDPVDTGSTGDDPGYNDPCAHGDGCNGGSIDWSEADPTKEGSLTDPNPATNGTMPWNW